jgi:hypothetical protein
MLRRQIKDLRRKGVDTSESWVDLHLKIALPAASIMMMLLAVPLTTAGTRVTSFAASIGLGFAVGFSYFVLVAFARDARTQRGAAARDRRVGRERHLRAGRRLLPPRRRLAGSYGTSAGASRAEVSGARASR